MSEGKGHRPNQHHSQQALVAQRQQQKVASKQPAQDNMSDRKIVVIQNFMIMIAVLLAATQTGLARGFGALIGSMSGYPQAEGWVDSTIFFSPYLCVAFVFFMLDFMKKK